MPEVLVPDVLAPEVLVPDPESSLLFLPMVLCYDHVTMITKNRSTKIRQDSKRSNNDKFISPPFL